jgi:DUF1680 family protein
LTPEKSLFSQWQVLRQRPPELPVPLTFKPTIAMRFTMLPSLFLLPFLAPSPATAQPARPVPFTAVRLQDAFWAPRLETVRQTTIPYAFGQCESTGRLRNFDLAAGVTQGAFCTEYAFDDSDVYKLIEGAAYSLQVQPDSSLEAYVDGLIDRIAAAQEPDGYLYTWLTIHEREKAAGVHKEETTGQFHRGSDSRWARVDQHSHELYNLGHLYEAAVAYYRATGKRTLLEVAIRSADLVQATFGWGKLEKATGHQEIEIGLVRLHQVTGRPEYLDLARFFLDVRGGGDRYMQDHLPAAQQREIAGHAVRACYMYTAMADLSAETGTEDYLPALHAIWNDVTGTKLYLTGGIGSSGSNEGFSDAYDLPNFSAYCETCASIAFVLWNQRMFQLDTDAQYIDLLERTLYNALNAGLSQTGDRFFYPNPLESRRHTERSPWFGCACCPSNVARFFPSLPGYIYAERGNELYVNLYVGSETTVEHVNSRLQPVAVTLTQETDYPWDGKVRLTVRPARPHAFPLLLRIPGWARGDAVPGDLYDFLDRRETPVFLKVNGRTETVAIRRGYAVLTRKWRHGDVVELTFPMPIRKVVADTRVTADAGQLALQRGPLVYCLEGQDQEDPRIHHLLVSAEADCEAVTEPDWPGGGIESIRTSGRLMVRRTGSDDLAALPAVRLKAIPYYTWANRGKDDMRVWLPFETSAARPVARPTLAARSRISTSEGVRGDPGSVADQLEPAHSADPENTFVHW